MTKKKPDEIICEIHHIPKIFYVDENSEASCHVCWFNFPMTPNEVKPKEFMKSIKEKIEEILSEGYTNHGGDFDAEVYRYIMHLESIVRSAGELAEALDRVRNLDPEDGMSYATNYIVNKELSKFEKSIEE